MKEPRMTERCACGLAIGFAAPEAHDEGCDRKTVAGRSLTATRTESKQKPSLGRIVLFKPSEGLVEKPAIITQVWEDADAVDLEVFGVADGEDQDGVSPRFPAVVKSGDGKTPRTWRWPPRVT